MSMLDQLYSLEVEFHHQSRSAGMHPADEAGLHTSYALQNGYEGLLRSIGLVDPPILECVKDRMSRCGDPRDVIAAFRWLQRLALD